MKNKNKTITFPCLPILFLSILPLNWHAVAVTHLLTLTNDSYRNSRSELLLLFFQLSVCGEGHRRLLCTDDRP